MFDLLNCAIGFPHVYAKMHSTCFKSSNYGADPWYWTFELFDDSSLSSSLFVNMERNTVINLSNWCYRFVNVESDFAILDATHCTIRQMRKLIRYACQACL